MHGPSGTRPTWDGGDETYPAKRAGADRRDVVAVLTDDQPTRLADRLHGEDRFDVHVADPDAIAQTIDRETTSCLVVGIDAPDRAKDLFERLRALEFSAPIVVAPREGSERLATVALRNGVADYVSRSNDEELVARVATAIDDVSGRSGPTGAERLHRVLANALPDEAFVIDEDGYYLEAKVRSEAGDLHTVPADELIGRHLEDAFPDDVTDKLLSCIDRTLETDEVRSIEYETETTKGTRQYEARVVPIDEPIDGRRAVVWLARDITERAERERELRQRRDQLETLNGINSVVRQVIRTLVEAPTREDIEREVCEQFVESDLYCCSWIGEPDGNGGITVRTSAGEATTFLEAVRDPEIEPQQPILETLETGEIRTSNRMQEEPRIAEPFRRAASEDDVRSAIAVPIRHGETIYGVLAVLASRDDAFSQREQSAFQLLGETIGFSINAVKNRRLLFADSVVELEIEIDGGDSLSFDLSESYDCTCYLEWAGDAAGGRIYQYVTVDGVDGETVMEEATDHDSVEECRLIHDGGDRCTIEVRLHESGVRTLVDHGVTIRDVTVSDGVGRTVVEVPPDADVRAVVDALQTVYDDAQLVARREVDRSVHTADERRERIADRLTDRQLTALRLAYYGGYFDWPRGSTGEEIAEAMGVSPPTMHQHLRKAQRELLTEFFDERSGKAT